MSCILAIDDRPINRQFLVSLLGYGGHTVLEAADGEEALGFVRQSHPDLVITDIRMPNLVLDRMKNIASLAGTPVIVVSARDPKTNEKRALDAGVEAFFQKPVDNEALMNAIQRALIK
jgi:CheY-like chemotaxis protein